MQCEKCHQDHDGAYGSGRFCSSRCAHSFVGSQNREQKTQKMLKTFHERFLTRDSLPVMIIKDTCKWCQQEFDHNQHDKIRFCSPDCKDQSFREQQRVKGRKGGTKSAQIQTRRSRNEIRFARLCSARFSGVITNQAIFNGWDADVILTEHKVAVLWNGKWHYEKITKKHSVLQVQTRDHIKLNEIAKCGYRAYIVQDMGSEDEQFVENQFELFLAFLQS